VSLYPEVSLKQGAHRRIVGGHLWIFSNELEDGFQSLDAGSLVRVISNDGRCCGIATLNPHSLIAGRLLTREDVRIDREFVQGKLSRAFDLRKRLLPENDTCRVVFSEADGLPGLIIDKFDRVVVYQSLTAGMDTLMPSVIEWIERTLDPIAMVAANDSSMRTLEGITQERKFILGEMNETSVFEQDDLKLICDPVKGQKTGYFLDQRLNRKLAQTFVRGGESVLDLFCYSGAFGAYLARAGAGYVTFVDGSARALELAKETARLNGFEAKCETLRADIFDWLKSGGKQYDIVSVDPPALAKSRSKAMQALRAYRDLNARAMKWVKPGGLLLTSSCSGLISRVNWREMIEQASFKSRRQVRFVAFGTQSPDHPVLAAMPETEYLKFAIAAID
jgi:23S rRNA (cytosine1962-C5)-methyltransferase